MRAGVCELPCVPRQHTGHHKVLSKCCDGTLGTRVLQWPLSDVLRESPQVPHRHQSLGTWGAQHALQRQGCCNGGSTVPVQALDMRCAACV